MPVLFLPPSPIPPLPIPTKICYTLRKPIPVKHDHPTTGDPHAKTLHRQPPQPDHTAPLPRPHPYDLERFWQQILHMDGRKQTPEHTDRIGQPLVHAAPICARRDERKIFIGKTHGPRIYPAADPKAPAPIHPRSPPPRSTPDLLCQEIF